MRREAKGTHVHVMNAVFDEILTMIRHEIRIIEEFIGIERMRFHLEPGRTIRMRFAEEQLMIVQLNSVLLQWKLTVVRGEAWTRHSASRPRIIQTSVVAYDDVGAVP